MPEANNSSSDGQPIFEAKPVLALGETCRHLRSKGMFVYTDVINVDEVEEGYDNTVYWCQKSQKDMGPDQGFVGRQDCRNTERACYEPV